MTRYVLALCFVLFPVTVISQQGTTCSTAEHSAWLGSVVQKLKQVKPGITRSQIPDSLVPESGFTLNPKHQTYVLRDSPYIKIDLEFVPVEEGNFVKKARPNDTVKEVSRPYLDEARMD